MGEILPWDRGRLSRRAYRACRACLTDALTRTNRFTPMPQHLLPLYTRSSITGLLPEVGYAYMTVRNVLYLWNYDESNLHGNAGAEATMGEADMIEFSGLDQDIVAVGLVRPQDCFYSKVKVRLLGSLLSLGVAHSSGHSTHPLSSNFLFMLRLPRA